MLTLTYSQKQILAFKEMNLLTQAVLARPIGSHCSVFCRSEVGVCEVYFDHATDLLQGDFILVSSVTEKSSHRNCHTGKKLVSSQNTNHWDLCHSWIGRQRTADSCLLKGSWVPFTCWHPCSIHTGPGALLCWHCGTCLFHQDGRMRWLLEECLCFPPRWSIAEPFHWKCRL